MVLTRRQKGPNIEENWGFTDPYGAPYAFANVCFQQMLIALAGGATGYNVYTAVGTASWNGDLDRFHARPCPSHPPIAADGTVTPKAAVLALLGRFLARHGAEFALCHSAAAVTWGRSYCACEPGKAECGAYQGL